MPSGVLVKVHSRDKIPEFAARFIKAAGEIGLAVALTEDAKDPRLSDTRVYPSPSWAALTAPRRTILALGLLLAAVICAVGCAAVQTGSEFEPVHVGPFAAIDSVNYDRAPMPTTMEPPAYPLFAQDAGIAGTVWLRILVDEDGRVAWVDAITPITGLTESAITAAKRWVFTPALRDGQPVSAAVKVPITFRLEGRP